MSATLSLTNGALRLTGPALDQMVHEALLKSGNVDQWRECPHSITLLTAQEHGRIERTYTVPEVDIEHVHVLGASPNIAGDGMFNLYRNRTHRDRAAVSRPRLGSRTILSTQT